MIGMDEFAAAIGYLVMASAGLAVAIGSVSLALGYASRKLGLTMKVYFILRDNAQAETDRTGA